jgi:hypothetical protein
MMKGEVERGLSGPFSEKPSGSSVEAVATDSGRFCASRRPTLVVAR